MGTIRKLLFVQFYNTLFWLLEAYHSDCKYNWTIQPPTDLNCNPLYTNITLSCGVEPMISNQTFITWFWIDKNCTEAMIQPSENYTIQPNDSNSSLSFFVTPNRMGYYWCQVQVDNTTVNSSISSILKLSNSYPCDETSVLNLHDRRECVNNTSHMRNTCKPIQGLLIAPVIVPVVIAFITLLVLWSGIISLAYNHHKLMETPVRPAPQKINRTPGPVVLSDAVYYNQPAQPAIDENSRIDHGASHPQAMENTDSHQIEDARTPVASDEVPVTDGNMCIELKSNESYGTSHPRAMENTDSQQIEDARIGNTCIKLKSNESYGLSRPRAMENTDSQQIEDARIGNTCIKLKSNESYGSSRPRVMENTESHKIEDARTPAVSDGSVLQPAQPVTDGNTRECIELKRNESYGTSHPAQAMELRTLESQNTENARS